MMEPEDVRLLETYMWGWADEQDERPEPAYLQGLYKRAYKLGRLDSEVNSVLTNSQTDSQILQKIKNI